VHHVEDPGDYAPTFPYGHGDVEASLVLAEPVTKKARSEAEDGPTGSSIRLKISDSKYNLSGPKGDLPLTKKIFEQFNKTGKDNFLFASKAKSSWRRCESALRWYRKFGKETGTLAIWPTDESADQQFLSWLGVQKTLSGGTAKQYFEELKSLQILMGMDPETNWGREKRTAAIIKGIENVKRGHKQPVWDPVTWHILREIRRESYRC